MATTPGHAAARIEASMCFMSMVKRQSGAVRGRCSPRHRSRRVFPVPVQCVVVPSSWTPKTTYWSTKDPLQVLSRSPPAALMYRVPVRPQRSPGRPRPVGRFPSPPPCWGFGSGPRGGSPGGGPTFSPGSPVYSPAFSSSSSRGYRDGSRGSGGPMWRRGVGGFRRPQSFSPSGPQNQSSSWSSSWSSSSDAPVEKYFSPAMLQDPWASLQPIAVTDSRKP